MKKYKILNLYACLGGNRFKWDEIAKKLGVELEVTAIELDIFLAEMYQLRFPEDRVICTDAHKYLLEHYKEYNFIWSSPPCPTHSKARFARHATTKSAYPDMKLYQEIIFLQNYFKGKFCVENVIPFYKPLIAGKKRGRHLYWTNFNLPNSLNERKCTFMEHKNEVEKWNKFHEINVNDYKGNQRKDKIARNLVDYEAGKTILETALGIQKKENIKQLNISFQF